MIPLSRPVITQEMISAMVDSVQNERLVNGQSVTIFEKEFARYIGANYAISTNSGTSALHLSLLGIGVERGDIVVLPSATFIATANAVSHTGALPQFIDINLSDYSLNLTQFKETINKYGSRIKAVIPVHLYGRVSNIKEILEIADQNSIKVLEDACQAHGAMYDSRKAGNFGFAGAFSFYTSKNMTVGGDGGMITSNDANFVSRVNSLKNQGSSLHDKYVHDYIGFNYRLNTINAAFGLQQLKLLNKWVVGRRVIAKRYLTELDGIGDLKLPPPDDDLSKSAWHLFVVRTKFRKKLSTFLNKKGIETGIHYPVPVHLQRPYSSQTLSDLKLNLDSTEQWANEVMSIPIYNEMANDSVDIVVDSIKSFFKVERK